MAATKVVRALALGMLLTLVASSANAQRLADGKDWNQSSNEMRIAYLVGISNTLSVGYQYDMKKLPEQNGTFSRRAVQGLGETSVAEAASRVDAWYKAHPDKLDTPVMAVLWIDIAKPRLAKTK